MGTCIVDWRWLTYTGHQTDNPGPWFLHCHIDPHLEAGFAVVLAGDTPDVKADNPEPSTSCQLPNCIGGSRNFLTQQKLGLICAPSTTRSLWTINEIRKVVTYAIRRFPFSLGLDSAFLL